MADGHFNIAKGALAEKFRDSGANGLILLLKANEAEATLIDRDTVALTLAEAGTTEADFTNYARKTGLTGTVTVDDVNDRVDIDMPDQTWVNAGGAVNNTLTKAAFCYEDSASDAGRVPGTHQDFAATTDGSSLTIELAAAGFSRHQ